MMSRYGESRTVSGTGIPRSAQPACSARASSTDAATVTAASVSGRLARANVSACKVGRCRRDTSTTAWIRAGSTSPRAAGSNSSLTRS